MQFKFTASIVDAIETKGQETIGVLVTNNKISNIVNILEKAYLNEDGRVGISKNVALAKIDEYLEAGNEIDDLVLDITEVLARDGFLSRDLPIEEMREMKKSRIKQVKEAIDEELEANQ